MESEGSLLWIHGKTYVTPEFPSRTYLWVPTAGFRPSFGKCPYQYLHPACSYHQLVLPSFKKSKPCTVPDQPLMAYFYCDFGDGAKRDICGLLTSLLGQPCANPIRVLRPSF
jgi:hypothetical protein